MKPQLSLKHLASFFSLAFLLHECHELTHTSVGRILCGHWGTRDFNVWKLYGDCENHTVITVSATLAGPMFTFMMVWIGVYFVLGNRTVQQKSIGLSLIFAGQPFIRLLNASFGIGDEIWSLTKLGVSHGWAWVIGFAAIALIVSLPLLYSFKSLCKEKRIFWFLLLFFAPTVVDLVVIEGLMNFLLEKNLLSSYWILGSPMLVSVWTISVGFVFVMTRKYVLNFFV